MKSSDSVYSLNSIVYSELALLLLMFRILIIQWAKWQVLSSFKPLVCCYMSTAASLLFTIYDILSFFTILNVSLLRRFVLNKVVVAYYWKNVISICLAFCERTQRSFQFTYSKALHLYIYIYIYRRDSI